MHACPPPVELEAFTVSGAARPDIREHLDRCAVCRAAAEEIRANHDFIKAARTDLLAAFSAQDRARNPTPTVPPEPAPLPAPGTVPGFELVEEITRGGQGVVYRAFHADTKRPAAVKMLLAGAFASGPQLRRFEREIEIAAGLRHPAIVSVFDSGVTADGRRYVAMELVSGVPIDDYVRDHFPLTPRSGRDRTEHILRLVRFVSDGVACAHASGILHRDLKPSNILVDAHGQPRILDFGLARPTERPGDMTLSCEFAGTPAFAAPEQFSSSLGAVSPRTDVYALGVILYHALTRAHPYSCDGAIADISRSVLSSEPTPPSRLVPRLPADAETIVLKALAKDPARRYPSAAALAADIDDYLSGRPISARRDSALYVLRRLASRHRIPTLALLLLALTILAATVGLLLLAGDLDRARRGTEAVLSDSNVQRARLMAAAGDTSRAESLLWHEARRTDMRTDDSLCFSGSPQALRSAWALAELYSRLPRSLRIRTGARAGRVGVNPAGDALWLIDIHGQRTSWARDGRLLTQTPALVPADSRSRMIATPDGRSAVVQTSQSLLFADLESGRTLAGPAPWPTALEVLVLSDDATLLLAVDRASPDQGATIFDAHTFQALASIPDRAFAGSFGRAPTGPLLLIGTAGTDPELRVRRAPDRALLRTVSFSRPSDPRSVATIGLRAPQLSPDGRYVIASSEDQLHLVDLEADAPPVTRGARAIIGRVCFDESGAHAAAFTEDGNAIVYRVPDLEPGVSFQNGSMPIASAFRTDAAALVIADIDGRLSVYEPSDRPWLTRIPASSRTSAAIAVAPDGSIAWGDDLGDLRIRLSAVASVTTTTHAHTGGISSVTFSPDGTRVLTAGFDGAIHIWTRDGAPDRSLANGLPETWCARYSPDGRSIASCERGGLVRVWNAANPAPPVILDTRSHRVPAIAFSPDGRSLLCGAGGGTGAVVLDLATGGEHRLTGPETRIRAVAYAPDGRTFVTGGDDRALRVWDARTAAPLRVIEGLPWGPFDLEFHRGGRVLFAVGRGPQVLVLDPEAGVELASLTVHDRRIFSIATSPDGRTLYTSGEDPWIGVIDLDRLRSYIRGNEGFWTAEPARPAP